MDIRWFPHFIYFRKLPFGTVVYTGSTAMSPQPMVVFFFNWGSYFFEELSIEIYSASEVSNASSSCMLFTWLTKQSTRRYSPNVNLCRPKTFARGANESCLLHLEYIVVFFQRVRPQYPSAVVFLLLVDIKWVPTPLQGTKVLPVFARRRPIS